MLAAAFLLLCLTAGEVTTADLLGKSLLDVRH